MGSMVGNAGGMTAGTTTGMTSGMTVGRVRWVAVVLCALAIVAAGCSDADAPDQATGTTSAAGVATTLAPSDGQGTQTGDTEASAPLTILVSNDDGIAHPGLDLMVRRLAELDNVEVVVVAPAENRSGTSDQTTDGGAPFADAATASGVVAIAVDGFPADSVRVALDELGIEPNVVVSGINDAQNVGPFAGLSGTVGVARTAARDGIPAVAVSAGLTYDEAQFTVGAELVVAWITENRQALADRTLPAEVISFNIPTCDPADMGEVVEVPLAEELPATGNVFASECDSSGPPPANDAEAIVAGFPTRTIIPPDLESIIRQLP